MAKGPNCTANDGSRKLAVNVGYNLSLVKARKRQHARQLDPVADAERRRKIGGWVFDMRLSKIGFSAKMQDALSGFSIGCNSDIMS